MRSLITGVFLVVLMDANAQGLEIVLEQKSPLIYLIAIVIIIWVLLSINYKLKKLLNYAKVEPVKTIVKKKTTNSNESNTCDECGIIIDPGLKYCSIHKK